LQNPRLRSRTGAILDQLTDLALATLVGEGTSTSAVLRFLLRRYGSTGREDLEAALGPALATVVALRPWIADPSQAPEWLLLFVDASNLSGDERMLGTAASLVVGLTRAWPAEQGVPIAEAMRVIDACLLASDVCPDADTSGQIIAAAIDELERILVPVYRPGEGIVPGGRSEHVAAASALLSAYERTGRLPYSMLAEELMRFALHTWPSAREQTLISCRAIPVLGRLAALQADPGYLEATVAAPDVGYAREAEALVEALAEEGVPPDIVTAMELGLALIGWLSLQGARG
jgi:hypothetical protein